MGRLSYSNRTKADWLEYISTTFLNKKGYFQCSHSGTLTWTRGEWKSSVNFVTSISDKCSYFRLKYTQTDRNTGEKKDFDYKIPLVTTPCQYGGKRYWFICPWSKNGIYCGRRVGKLYKNGDYFACRHCHNLTYDSRKINRKCKSFPLFNVLDIEQKIEELYETIKRPYWRGKPTKKQRQLEMLQRQINTNLRKCYQLERQGML